MGGDKKNFLKICGGVQLCTVFFYTLDLYQVDKTHCNKPLSKNKLNENNQQCLV